MPESQIVSSDLEEALKPLDAEARRSVLLAIEENWSMPPMTRWTAPSDDDTGYLTGRMPRIVSQETGAVDISKIDQMLATGQIAYPMALKKAPITSIVRSPSGFTVKCSNERLAKLMHVSLSRTLGKRIEEILTFLEYGAYYGEVTYGMGWPQDYGLKVSTTPWWILEDLNGCHPGTIAKIKRNEGTKAFEGFVQEPMVLGDVEGVTVGLDRALLIPNRGTFGKLEGQSELEPVYVWWFWYEMIWRAFLRFLQRAGAGVVIVKAPGRGRVKVQGKYVDNMAWALQMASSLHRTNYAALPSDMSRDSGEPLWAIDTLKLSNNEGRQFIEALGLLGDNIKNFLLTGNKESPDGGEYEVMLDTERVLSHIGVFFSEYVLPKWLMWNGAKTRVATLEFQGANSRILPLLFKLMAVAGNTAGDALQNVKWRELFSKGGVPVLEEEEVESLIQKQDKREADREKAKMQPGGEGRWDSQRDEEGDYPKFSDDDRAMFESMVHSNKMIAEALDTPLIAASARQVVEIEDIGARLDDVEVQLANPYHDKVGKFTDKAGATGRIKDLPNEKKIRAAEAIEKHIGSTSKDLGIGKPKVGYYGSTLDYAKAACDASSGGAACVVIVSRSLAAEYDGKVFIGPKVLDIYNRDRRGGEYIVTHEVLHAKKRSDGSLGMDIEKFGSRHSQHTAKWTEEGCTDLLARKHSGMNRTKRAGRTKVGYGSYMRAISAIAWKASGGDREKAWGIVDDIHFNINDPATLHKYMTAAFREPSGGWSDRNTYGVLHHLQGNLQGRYALRWMFGEDKE